MTRPHPHHRPTLLLLLLVAALSIAGAWIAAPPSSGALTTTATAEVPEHHADNALATRTASPVRHRIPDTVGLTFAAAATIAALTRRRGAAHVGVRPLPHSDPLHRIPIRRGPPALLG